MFNRVGRSRLGILVLAGVLCGALAACGGPEKLTSKTLFPRVAKAQNDAGSSQIAMKLTAPGGQTFNSHGQMKIGKEAKDTAMAMTISGQTGGLGTIELRLVNRAFYIELGALTQNKFAKIDLTDKSNPIARQYGDIIENIDPARQIKQYRDAVTKFDSSGKPVKIDGVETQPYDITINPSKASNLKGMSKANLPKRIAFTLYVGPDDLPRRMISKVPGAAGTTRLQMDYTKWGEKVSIKAPSASKIIDDSFLSRLGAQAPAA